MSCTNDKSPRSICVLCFAVLHAILSSCTTTGCGEVSCELLCQVDGLTFPTTGHLMLDLSFKELVPGDVPALCDMLASHPALRINFAHNRVV